MTQRFWSDLLGQETPGLRQYRLQLLTSPSPHLPLPLPLYSSLLSKGLFCFCPFICLHSFHQETSPSCPPGACPSLCVRQHVCVFVCVEGGGLRALPLVTLLKCVLIYSFAPVSPCILTHMHTHAHTQPLLRHGLLTPLLSVRESVRGGQYFWTTFLSVAWSRWIFEILLMQTLTAIKNGKHTS